MRGVGGEEEEQGSQVGHAGPLRAREQLQLGTVAPAVPGGEGAGGGRKGEG